MKKVSVLALALLMLLSLSACGKPVPGAPAATSHVAENTAQEGTYMADGRQFITAEQLKTDMESGKELFLLDIQLEDAFNEAHLKNAVATYAYPVETDDEKAKVDAVLKDAKGKELIIICPGGKGGANNTWDHLAAGGYDMHDVYILEKGQKGWIYPDLLDA